MWKGNKLGLDNFHDQCIELADALTKSAFEWRPSWNWHPGGKIKPMGKTRCEFNKQRQQKGLGTIYLQYIFKPNVIQVALYLTYLDLPELACNQIDTNRTLIEREVGPCSSWDLEKEAKCRFTIPTRIEGWQDDRSCWSRVVPGLVGMMWRFHKFTLPIIGYEPST